MTKMMIVFMISLI